MARSISRVLLVLLYASGWVRAGEPPGAWLDVPFVKQQKNGCGAASVAMVMQYWQRQRGKSADPSSDAERIQRALYSSQARGIYASDLEHYLAQRGFQTFAFAGTLNDLRQHLEKGRPLIVALKPSRRAPRHYVVVAGLDSERGAILLNDPAERKLRKREQAGFEKEWKDAGHWMLLAVPQSEGASPR